MFSKKSPKEHQRLSDLPSTPVGVFSDPVNAFAEIYGGAKVGEQRMFVVAVAAIALALAAFAMYVVNSRSNIAVPWLVEVNGQQGVINKPVRIETVRPSDAVLKAELAKWIQKIFTIDNLRSKQLFGEANKMTKGLGTEQFTEFRVKQNVTERMTRDVTLQRRAEVRSVDVSQKGVAFLFLSTHEAQGNNPNSASAAYRVTLKYEINPPQTEEEILANPLGLYITSMNVTEEGAQR